MTEKELRKLNRRDLLEMLIFQTKRANELESKLNNARSQLEGKDISLDSVGSMAQAALRLSGIFEAADDAAYKYLEAVRDNIGENCEPAVIFESLKALDEYREGRKTQVVICEKSGSSPEKSENVTFVPAPEQEIPLPEQDSTVSKQSLSAEKEQVKSEPEQNAPAETEEYYAPHTPLTLDELNRLFNIITSESETEKQEEKEGENGAKSPEYIIAENGEVDYDAYFRHRAEQKAADYEKELMLETEKRVNEYRMRMKEKFSSTLGEIEQMVGIFARSGFDKFVSQAKESGNKIWELPLETSGKEN